MMQRPHGGVYLDIFLSNPMLNRLLRVGSYTKSAYYRRVIFFLPLLPGASPASSAHQGDCLLSKADLVLFGRGGNI